VRENISLETLSCVKITQRNDATNTEVSTDESGCDVSRFTRGCNFALLPFHHLHHRHQKNLQRHLYRSFVSASTV